MNIVGDRRYVEIPGEKRHELPPLLVNTHPEMRRLDKMVQSAERLVESDVIPATFAEPWLSQELERRRMDLAIQMVEQYRKMVTHWQWGDGIIEWIRQCETTFEARCDLRPLLRPDIWPHASRSSFVTLIEDKHVETDGVDVEKAVGFRLAFRQPPPFSCCSDQFLFYLNGSVADTAYQTWSHLSANPSADLPPERFSFDVVAM